MLMSLTVVIIAQSTCIYTTITLEALNIYNFCQLYRQARGKKGKSSSRQSGSVLWASSITTPLPGTCLKAPDPLPELSKVQTQVFKLSNPLSS